MFDDKKVEVAESGSGGKFLSYGNHKVAITGFSVKTSKAGDSWQVSLNVETPTELAEGFKADDNAVRGGKVGRVLLDDVYYKTAEQIKGFDGRMQILARKAGVLDQLLALKNGASSIEEYMNKVLPLFSGKDMYLQMGAKEYKKSDGNTGLVLFLPRYEFCASLAEGESHLKPFDKTNKYMYKKLEEAPSESSAEESTGAKMF